MLRMNGGMIMELAEKLKSMRKKAGLTQKEVADKLGITYQSYGQYERGLRKPKYETVEKFAKALNFDISELLTPAEESKMIIDGLLDEFESRKKDRRKRQNDAEARVGGDYSVYLMNLLVDHAQIISALTSMGVDIRFETSKNVAISYGIVKQLMGTASFAEKLEKLSCSFNQVFGNSELLNPGKDGE